MNNIYYSQFKEDIYLNDNIFKNKKNGIYIELGAMDGVLYSNTKFYEDSLGWSGILIEPHKENFNLLSKNRPNNFLFNNLVSSETEELKYRFFVNGFSSVSGIEKTLPKGHFTMYYDTENENIKSKPQDFTYIKPISLTEVVLSTGIKYIDLLSLDVEGHEYEVLKSYDFSIPIDVILIEMLEDNEEKNKLCRDILLNNNYRYYGKIHHNEVYVLKQNSLCI